MANNHNTLQCLDLIFFFVISIKSMIAFSTQPKLTFTCVVIVPPLTTPSTPRLASVGAAATVEVGVDWIGSTHNLH